MVDVFVLFFDLWCLWTMAFNFVLVEIYEDSISCACVLLQRDVLSNPVCSVKLSYFVISCAFTTLMEWETVKIYHSSPSDGSENDPNLSVRFDKVSNFAISTTPVKSCRFDSIYMSRSALLPFPRWPYCHVWREMNPVTNVCCRGAMAMVHGPWFCWFMTHGVQQRFQVSRIFFFFSKICK